MATRDDVNRVESRILRYMFELYATDPHWESLRGELIQLFVRALNKWFREDGPPTSTRLDYRDAALREIAEILFGGPFPDPATRRDWIKHNLLEPVCGTIRVDPEPLTLGDVWVPGEGSIV